ncbi:hypothetical protein BEWA_034280 [Theileria equi strain WA]|uniref:Uncharacterized protein n=1 Tax=Theileria equi strain WA TaxID=1537102 RepID=L0AZZ2_THEEQ|nr:hypothetical protein BEWA_034280 [Theileria equi strain WA]AFZ80571.1 hypothetical protein BEWA_034280 [Theileria equi strain WA]|eukprot:XP_004830237.1 hypothetical protein BEWA_034280 [Theileria equi strain WA]
MRTVAVRYRISNYKPFKNGSDFMFRWNQCRFAKIMRWLADTPHAHSMEKLTHFDDLINYCLDNKDTLGKRDIIASLSYMSTLKFNLSCKNFIKYTEIIYDKLDMFDSSIHLLVHRYAILGYNPALVTIYERYIKKNLCDLNNKALSLIAWGYAKNNVFIYGLFDTIATTIMHREEKLYLTDISLLLWSFAKIEVFFFILFIRVQRRVPHEIQRLKGELLEILNSITIALSNDTAGNSDITKSYMDNKKSFYSNIIHDVSMAAKSLAILLPRDIASIMQILRHFFSIAKLANLPIVAQGITSIWETLQYSNITDEEILEDLCEASRYLRLDHSFNSNMLNSIITAIDKLNIRDPRIIYQIVHWLEKRSSLMYPPQMYNIICLLDKMSIYHEKAWKQLGVVVQKKAIDLELNEIKHLYSIFKRNGKKTKNINMCTPSGKGNDRIYGVLDHFMLCKQDMETYGPT